MSPVMNLTSRLPRILPQYDENSFASAIDCEACKLVNGMRLTSAWASTIDEGMVNVCFECSFCHKRKWDRLQMPEVRNDRTS
jgi:hypothetical protein